MYQQKMYILQQQNTKKLSHHIIRLIIEALMQCTAVPANF